MRPMLRLSRAAAWALLALAVLLAHGLLLHALLQPPAAWAAVAVPGPAVALRLIVRATTPAVAETPPPAAPAPRPSGARQAAAARMPAVERPAGTAAQVPATAHQVEAAAQFPATAHQVEAAPQVPAKAPRVPAAAQAAAAAQVAALAPVRVVQGPPAQLPAVAPVVPVVPVAVVPVVPMLVPGEAMAAAPTAAAALPVYATRLPDAVSLHYRLQRGESVGRARLQWQRDTDGYLLRLDTAWPGQPPSGSASRGLIDAEGVAPLRHAELRRAREVRAANFQREAGRITFSGPQLTHALPPGAQDRLSWMLQLPAILEADAALARVGASITLFVAGTRGDADPWRFEVLGAEALALPAGAVAQALHLRREPTRPYDTRVEVWLDPARQHLPVRALFTTLPGGAPLQMELDDPQPELEIGAASPR